MKTKLLIVSTGFALFSMFFGSGNLVFPIAVGQESHGHYFLAALGILLTGVVVPFLGVFGMLLYEGDLEQFFRWLGKKGTLLFSLFALSLMGPFGVLARCLTVAHGAITLLIPEAPLVITSIYLCVVIFLLAINKNRIVTTLGTILTPFLLISIGAIAFFGLKNGSFPPHSGLHSLDAFKNGFFQGYQTMDLLAAFFFSTFVIQQLKSRFQTSTSSGRSDSSLRLFFKASLVGGGILSIVYLSLVMLGWIYAPILAGHPPQEMLGKIAIESLGSYAAPAVGVAVIFACLTTAIVLTTLFADFIRKEVVKDKINNPSALLITLAIGFMVSTLEFAGIAKFLGPLLEMIYPVLIALTVVNIGLKLWSRKFAPKGS